METDKWFPSVGACDKSQTARATLYCLGHAGSTPADYAAWDRQHASPALCVRAVCLPGRPPRHHEPRPASVAAVATAVAAAIERDVAAASTAAPARAVVLYGESYGALLAYETARRLTGAAAARLAAVVVASRTPPSAPAPDAAHQLARIADDRAFVAAVARAYGDPALARVAAAPGDCAAPLVARQRADLRACEGYAGAAARLPCPVLACRGRDDPATCDADIAAWARDFGAAHSATRTYAGGHFFARAEPVAHALVADIEAFVGQCAGARLLGAATGKQERGVAEVEVEEDMLLCF